MKKRVLLAKKELNCSIILLRVCGVSKGQGLLEETSWTLLTPSSPREAMGNDPNGLCC